MESVRTVSKTFLDKYKIRIGVSIGVVMICVVLCAVFIPPAVAEAKKLADADEAKKLADAEAKKLADAEAKKKLVPSAIESFAFKESAPPFCSSTGTNTAFILSSSDSNVTKTTDVENAKTRHVLTFKGKGCLTAKTTEHVMTSDT